MTSSPIAQQPASSSSSPILSSDAKLIKVGGGGGVSRSLAAKRILQSRGLSPRPAATIEAYQAPFIGDKSAWLPPSHKISPNTTTTITPKPTRNKVAGVSLLPPPKPVSFIHLEDEDEEDEDDSSTTTAASVVYGDEIDEDGQLSSSSTASSVSVNRSPPPLYHVKTRVNSSTPPRRRSASRTHTTENPHIVDIALQQHHYSTTTSSSCVKENDDEIDDEDEYGSSVDILTKCGYVPYRIARLSVSKDAFVFAVTTLGDRVALYYDEKTIKHLEKRGKFFKGLTEDNVTERVLKVKEDAEDVGVVELAHSAGIAANSYGASAKGPILGTITVASSPSNIDALRYFAVMYSDDKNMCSSSGGIKTNNNSSRFFASRNQRGVSLFISMLSSDALESPKEWVYTQGVVPVAHSDMISNGYGDQLAQSLRKACLNADTTHVKNVGTTIHNSLDSCLKRVTEKFDNLTSISLECIASREIDAFKLTSSRVPGSRATVADALRLAELTSYGSRTQEILGEAATVATSALESLEMAIDDAISTLFIETRITNTSSVPLKKISWGEGFPLELLDNISFAPLKIGDSPKFKDSGVSTLLEFAPRLTDPVIRIKTARRLTTASCRL